MKLKPQLYRILEGPLRDRLSLNGVNGRSLDFDRFWDLEDLLDEELWEEEGIRDYLNLAGYPKRR